MPLVRFHLSKYTGSVAPIENFSSGWGAALSAESHKKAKYLKLSVAHNFTPMAVETLGAWGHDASQLVFKLVKRIAAVSVILDR